MNRTFLRLKHKKILKVSMSTIQEVMKKKIETGDIKNVKMSGRPTKLTKSDCKYQKITHLRNRTKSSCYILA